MIEFIKEILKNDTELSLKVTGFTAKGSLAVLFLFIIFAIALLK